MRKTHGEAAAAAALEAEERLYLLRNPKDWQIEAAQALASGVAPRAAQGRFAGWVEQQRALALEQVRDVSALIIVRATRAAQQQQRGCIGALFYGGVRPIQILECIPPDALPLIALGPARPLRAILDEASERRPGDLWRERTGWRSLGVRRDKRPPRDALGWLRDSKGRRVG